MVVGSGGGGISKRAKHTSAKLDGWFRWKKGVTEIERDGSGCSHRREATHCDHKSFDSCASNGSLAFGTWTHYRVSSCRTCLPKADSQVTSVTPSARARQCGKFLLLNSWAGPRYLFVMLLRAIHKNWSQVFGYTLLTTGTARPVYVAKQRHFHEVIVRGRKKNRMEKHLRKVNCFHLCRALT